MLVIETSKIRKIIKVGINLIIPIFFLIYSITFFLNSALIGNDLGDYLINYKSAIFISIGISISITLLFYISRVFPNNSFKRNVNSFLVSLLMLIDGCLWANFSVLEISIEDVGFFSVDSTLIFVGLIIFLSITVFLRGLHLLNRYKTRGFLQVKYQIL